MASPAELKKTFTALAKRDRLSHAYLLFGEDGGAAVAIAKSLARTLEGGAWEPEGALLFDATVVGEGGLELGIDEVREVSRFLSLSPLRSPRRTAILAGAERMTIPAQQAALKIVEEPPQSGFLILIARDPDSLLPTLRSRLQRFFVSGEAVPADAAAQELFTEFLGRDGKGRKEFLKELVEDDAAVASFLRAAVAHLRRGLPKAAPALAALLGRMAAMGRFQTNRRLQLEAALLTLM